jgi:hypothetical protein
MGISLQTKIQARSEARAHLPKKDLMLDDDKSVTDRTSHDCG